MQVFQTDKRLYLISELKNWVWTFALLTILYFSASIFWPLKTDGIIIGIIVVLLLRLADLLTQYHVAKIQIDQSKNEIIFVLKSIMSGDKVKKYELKQATSELLLNSGLTKFWSAPYILKIIPNPDNTFRLTNRYGFTLKVLESIDQNLKYQRNKTH